MSAANLARAARTQAALGAAMLAAQAYNQVRPHSPFYPRLSLLIICCVLVLQMLAGGLPVSYFPAPCKSKGSSAQCASSTALRKPSLVEPHHAHTLLQTTMLPR